MTDIAELTRLIEPHAEAMGLAIVRVAMLGGTSDPTLQVMAERPDTRQLQIEDCAELSRRISETLDVEDPIEHAYRLEVSSPGIDRPLTRLQDFADWAGFDARIKLTEAVNGRKQFDGRLSSVDGDSINIIEAKSAAMVTANIGNIRSAKLLLTDKLIAATAPLSIEGVDTISQER